MHYHKHALTFPPSIFESPSLDRIVLSSWHALFLFSCSVNLVKKSTLYNCHLHFLTFFKLIRSGFCFIYFLIYFYQFPETAFARVLGGVFHLCARSTSHFLSPYFSFQHHSTHSLPWNTIFFWHFWQQILLISLSFTCHFFSVVISGSPIFP